MQLTWYGHSSFLLENQTGVRVLTDPCDPETGYTLSQIQADIVTVSHGHHDHNHLESVAGVPEVISAPGIRRIKDVCIAGFSTWHDMQQGAARGSNILYVYEMDGIRLVHLGDVGHLPDPALVEAVGPVDVLMCPIGGTYTADAVMAKQIILRMQPQLFIPMHYKTPALTFELDGLDPFMQIMQGSILHRVNDSTITITPDSLVEKRILILEYKK